VLFYIKRYLSLEIAVTLLLGALGYWGIRGNALPFDVRPTPQRIALGVPGSLWLALWSLLVQRGYSLFKGKVYEQELTTVWLRSTFTPGRRRFSREA
jgi:hypothetical protein